jgi:asparagine synthase (glutamine-hydrolysing)
MCAIAGIYGENISTDLKKMLISLKHRGPDISGVWIDGMVIHQDIDHLDITDGLAEIIPESFSKRSSERSSEKLAGKKSMALGHNLLSIVGCEGSQPITRENLVLVCNGEIYNYRELKNSLSDSFKTDSDCEVIVNLVEYFNQGNLLKALKNTISLLDGDYAFALWDGKNLALARDPVGVKPLYYGEIKGKIKAFASERKALWNLGITEVHNLPAGYILFNDELVKVGGPFKDSNSFKKEEKIKITPANMDMGILKDHLENALKNSVEKRIRGLEKVGLIFSGGVDSTILASILKNLSVETTLYTVGTENSPDLEFALQAADYLDLNIRTCVVNEEMVRRTLEPVIEAIEEFNVMKIGVGMPTYLAAQMVHEDGIRVALSGQGADELFGGYHRYLKSFDEKGENIQNLLKEDIENIYHVNLQRDDAVTMAHGVELRVPFLDKDVINVAFNIPVKYKIENRNDSIRKHILRQVALDVGVPDFIAHRPKKAAQYGSGIHKILIKKVLKEFDQEAFMKDLHGF